MPAHSEPTEPPKTYRDDLTKRTIPYMVLRDPKAPVPRNPSTSQTSKELSPAEKRFSVKGNAIVTGGMGVLGMACIIALLEHGLQGLMILDLDVSSPEASKKLSLLRTSFPETKVEGRQLDVTNEASVNKAVEETAQILGSVDILLCFTGMPCCVHALEVSIDLWRQVLDINTTGSFICAQACAKQMAKQGTRGSIVLTASLSAHRVNFPQAQSVYNVSKAALLSMKNCLAAEWARYGIRTNSISPGYMDTIMNEGEGLREAREMWAQRNPTGRLGQPEELTGAVVLLASGASTYINGADIVIDGGVMVF